jgi:hypothetical protein
MVQRDQKQPDVASAMWPHLSRAAKAEGQRQIQWQAEQKERSKRMVKNLDVIIEEIRAEKRGR